MHLIVQQESLYGAVGDVGMDALGLNTPDGRVAPTIPEFLVYGEEEVLVVKFRLGRLYLFECVIGELDGLVEHAEDINLHRTVRESEIGFPDSHELCNVGLDLGTVPCVIDGGGNDLQILCNFRDTPSRAQLLGDKLVPLRHVLRDLGRGCVPGTGAAGADGLAFASDYHGSSEIIIQRWI